MPGFPLLDIAIGLVFVYLLLSLICSSVSEGLESFLRNRATDLEAGIRNLLGDENGSWWCSFLPWTNSIEAKSITREFYLHPLIRSLFRGETQLPNYIPVRNFSLAIMDMASGAGSAAANAPATASPVIADAVNGVPLPVHLKKSLEVLVRAANGDAEQARVNIENWFNGSMDRVSGWYKSRTQKILFAIGVVVTIAVNADSIALFRNFSHNKNLQTVVAAAGNVTDEKTLANSKAQTRIGDAMNQLTGLDIGLGWAGEKAQSGSLDRTKVPPSLDPAACATETWPCTNPVSWSFHLLWLHGIGWLITAAAISLGAPFWFDTLNRIMVVRSTVKPDEKSPAEGSKS